MGAVLVLNADLGPLHRVSLRHAIRMLCRQVAVVHEVEPDRRLGVFPVPRILRLVHYVVVACDPGNQRKGDRTPAEAGMVLRVEPTAPTWASLARR